MAEEKEKEVPEYYADHFMIAAGPYGAVINFAKSPPEPGPGKTPEVVARIRMSYEHMKAITFVLARHIKKVERENGVSYPIPGKVLSGMGIAAEDWESFWKSANFPL
jgi:hypothetical protein